MICKFYFEMSYLRKQRRIAEIERVIWNLAVWHHFYTIWLSGLSSGGCVMSNLSIKGQSKQTNDDNGETAKLYNAILDSATLHCFLWYIGVCWILFKTEKESFFLAKVAVAELRTSSCLHIYNNTTNNKRKHHGQTHTKIGDSKR